MSDLEKLSAKKLHDVIARRNAHWSAILDQTIVAGLGNARFSDMVELAKGSSLLDRTNIARDYLNAHRDWKAALDELDRRKAYHGGDKPIKRQSA
jgi:formamidopyrimidine-DNA glycosylase